MSYHLPVSSLIITQNSVRDTVRIRRMVDFIKNNGRFNIQSITNHSSNPRLIMVSVFPDGQRFLHDGHHRTLSVYLAGRSFLYEEEFRFVHWRSYNQYNEINFKVGYVTPFDPRYEVRINDFLSFKQKVLAIAKVSQACARKFILENKSRYCMPRGNLQKIEDLLTGGF